MDAAAVHSEAFKENESAGASLGSRAGGGQNRLPSATMKFRGWTGEAALRWARVEARKSCACFAALWFAVHAGRAAEREPFVPVAAQPLAANVSRLVQALDFLGAP